MNAAKEPDWACEKACHIYAIVKDNWAEESLSKIKERIVYDLRKAKADGMRDAAKELNGMLFLYPQGDNKAWLPIAESFLELSDKIEKGEE